MCIYICIYVYIYVYIYLPSGSDSEESACNSGGLDLIPGLERSSGEGNGNALLHSCLENFLDRGVWRATVHGVAKSWAWLSDFHYTTIVCIRIMDSLGFTLEPNTALYINCNPIKKKKRPIRASSGPYAMWEHSGKRASQEADPRQSPNCYCFDLGLPASGTIRNKCLVCKLPAWLQQLKWNKTSVHPKSLSCFFLIDFCWCVIALQRCVTFCCTAKWTSCMYTYRPLFFWISFRVRSPQSAE